MTEKQRFIHRALKDQDHPYFSMRRATAQDKTLTWEARGMLSYILSQSDTWRVQPKDLEQNCGKSIVYRVLKELIEHRYIDRVAMRNEKKQIVSWDYAVHEEPLPKKQEVALPEVAKLELGNQDIRDNKEESEKREKKNPSKTKRQVLVEQLTPYISIAHTILSLIEEGYSGEMNTPDSYMTIPHMEKYLPHLEELARLEATPDELKCLHAYFKPIYDKGEWTIGVKTFVEKLQPYRTIKAKLPAARPAPIIADTPPATPEERAALLEAMANIRPEWEKDKSA